jgi:hypothetical protein
MAALALFVFVIAWFLLPFTPTLVEIWRKRDSEPMRVVRDYDVDIHHFANGFRKNVLGPLQDALDAARDDGRVREGRRTPSGSYVVLTGNPKIKLTAREKKEKTTDRMFLSLGPLSTPAETSFVSALYSGDSFSGAEGNIYRALLAEKDIHLAQSSMLLRWMHAEGAADVEAGCILHGRSSAGGRFRIGIGCHFERLHAPLVEFGERRGTERKKPGPRSTTVLTLDEARSMTDIEVTGRRWLIEDDFQIPPRREIAADIVVAGEFRVGAGARVAGSIKSHGDLWLEPNAMVTGSVVSGRDLYAGVACDLHGPVIAERDAHIGAGCRIGREDHLSTVSARYLWIAYGTVVFGTVWAREYGETTVAGPVE